MTYASPVARVRVRISLAALALAAAFLLPLFGAPEADALFGSADVELVSLADSKDPVNVNEPFKYTATVRNNDLGLASNVRVQLFVSAGLEISSATASIGTCGIPAGGAVECNLAAMAGGETRTVELNVVPRATGTQSAAAQVSADEIDPEPGNNARQALTTVGESLPDLTVTKTDDKDPVQAFDQLTYTLTASNADNADGDIDNASGVVLIDRLPDEVEFDSASPGCNLVGPDVICQVGDLAEGASVAKQIVVAPQGPGVISNSVQIAGNEADPVDNNVDVEETTVTDTDPDLAIQKADNIDPVTQGADLTYTLTARNLDNSDGNPDPATGVTISDPLPAGVSFVSASEGCSFDIPTRTVTCAIGGLAEGASAVRTVVVTPTAVGSISNTATISGDQADLVPVNDSALQTTTVVAPDLAISKADSVDPASKDVNLTYTLTVENLANAYSGPQTATGVEISDPLPQNVDFVSASDGCTYDEPTHTVTCAIGDIAEGASVQRTIVVKPTQTGAISNTATVTGDQTGDPVGGNNSDTEGTDVQATTPDLALTKVESKDPVRENEDLTYTLNARVKDNGDGNADPATGVTVIDPLPAAADLISAADGCTYDQPTHTVTCAIGNLAEGELVQKQVVVRVHGTSVVINNASITGNEVADDPDASNNDATALTVVNAVTPDLSISKSDDADPVAGGAPLTYTLAVTNQDNGNALADNASGVVATDTLPASVNFVSADDSCAYNAGTHTVICDLGYVDEGETKIREIAVTTTTGGTLSNTATVGGDQTDPVPANDSSTEETVVDTTAPDTQVDSGPADGSTIATSSPEFAFSGVPAEDTAKIQCKLDDGVWEDCASPKTFSGLADGAHTAAFRAEDAVGNQDQTPAERTFTVDTVAPDTQVDSGPANGAMLTADEATFEFSGTPAGDTTKIQCKLDDGAYVDCASPKTFSGLADGEHTVAFRAEDAVGNQDATPAERTFTVDTIVPDTQIDSGPADGSTLTTNEATFSFAGTPGADTAKIQCQLDGGAFEDCTSPKTFSGLSEATHTVAFRAQDAAGNQDATPAMRTFMVDLSQARCDAATARFNQAIALRRQAKDDYAEAQDDLDAAKRRLETAKDSGKRIKIKKARKQVRRARAAKQKAGDALDWATGIWRKARDDRNQACA